MTATIGNACSLYPITKYLTLIHLSQIEWLRPLKYRFIRVVSTGSRCLPLAVWVNRNRQAYELIALELEDLVRVDMLRGKASLPRCLPGIPLMNQTQHLRVTAVQKEKKKQADYEECHSKDYRT
jgi:hypothetical protein